MKTNSIDNLKVGEVLEQLLLFDEKNICLPSGVAIEKEDIELLKKWHISELNLLDPNKIQSLKTYADLFEAFKYEKYNYIKLFDDIFDTLKKFFISIKNKNNRYFNDLRKHGEELIKLCHYNPDLLTFSLMTYKKNITTIPIELMSLQIAVMSTIIGKRVGLDNPKLQVLFESALLIDIGMMGMPNQIAMKNSNLTTEDNIAIKKHPIISYKMAVTHLNVSKLHAVAILSHHEHVDGTGYPQKLVDNQISTLAKIIGVCQAFIAITEKRQYRESKDYSLAMKELISDAGIKYHPTIIKAFIGCFSLHPIGSIVQLSNHFISIVIQSNFNLPLRPIVKPILDNNGNINIQRAVDLSKQQEIAIKETIKDEKIIAKVHKEL